MLYVFERQCPACGTVNVRLTAGANAVWTCRGCKRDLTQPTACRVLRQFPSAQNEHSENAGSGATAKRNQVMR